MPITSTMLFCTHVCNAPAVFIAVDTVPVVAVTVLAIPATTFPIVVNALITPPAVVPYCAFATVDELTCGRLDALVSTGAVTFVVGATVVTGASVEEIGINAGISKSVSSGMPG